MKELLKIEAESDYCGVEWGAGVMVAEAVVIKIREAGFRGR